MLRAIALVAVLFLAGCASRSYRETPDARFTGTIDVRWIRNDYFVFIPSKEDPFAMIRGNGERIEPGVMYTDGGSIPRFLWGIEGYSPWGYAPAYIVHDWLFEAKHCGYDSAAKYSFQDSVQVMAEGLKAVMELFPEYRSKFVFSTVVKAVGSPIAEKMWVEGGCEALPTPIPGVEDEANSGELLMTIRFPPAE